MCYIELTNIAGSINIYIQFVVSYKSLCRDPYVCFQAFKTGQKWFTFKRSRLMSFRKHRFDIKIHLKIFPPEASFQTAIMQFWFDPLSIAESLDYVRTFALNKKHPGQKFFTSIFHDPQKKNA